MFPHFPNKLVYQQKYRGRTFYILPTNNVAGELAQQHLVHVHADLHVVAAARGAEVLNTGHLGGKPHAPGALNTPGHKYKVNSSDRFK